MDTTFEERKNKAVEILNNLDIYKPYIKGFKDNNEVCYFEKFAGFWTWQDEQLQNKIKEIETKYNCTVYAVTHELTEFGELYDLLVITNDKDDWQELVTSYNQNIYYALAYVWNKDDELCSEFGDILIQSALGGIKRVC